MNSRAEEILLTPLMTERRARRIAAGLALAGLVLFGPFVTAASAEPSFTDKERTELYRVLRQQSREAQGYSYGYERPYYGEYYAYRGPAYEGYYRPYRRGYYRYGDRW